MFELGQVYRRRDEIHKRYGGQSQGGISTPAYVPMVFLFTSDSGADYGYEDQFRPDGVFWYTGEGQVGDMEMVRGNLAIRDHEKNKKVLHLFEYVRTAYVRYLGEFNYVGHHVEQRPDRNGNLRNAFIFHLAFIPPSAETKALENVESEITEKPSLQMSLEVLRKLAIENASAGADKLVLAHNTSVRAAAIRLYALKRASGVCEGCRSPAPFAGKDGPFLEVHHVYRLGDGGPDHPACVVALCPNCHRRVHHGVDGQDYNEELIERLKVLEPSE